MSTERTRTAWGYTRFGTGRRPALTVAVPGGLVLSATGGLISVLTGVAGSHPALGFWVFTAFLAVPCVALVYALVVDRNSIEGATGRPDDSIESGWYNKAATGAFTDVVLLLGGATMVLAFIPRDFPVDLKLVLPSVIMLAFASFGIRYLLLRSKA